MRKSKFLFLCSCVLLCFVCGCKTTGGSQQTAASQQPVNVLFIADSAYAYCQAQCDFGPRTMNSDAHERCAQWIQQKFEELGCDVELQKADLHGYDGTVLKATNIIARTAKGEGQRPRILVCAHWDSRPWADNDPDKENWKKPVMAANDGASGVGVMLELARLIQQNRDSVQVDVDFVCFDAEDWGIPQWSDAADNGNTWALGSQYWAASISQQPSAAAQYQYGILLDMVGSADASFTREYYSAQYASGFQDLVWNCAAGHHFINAAGGAVTDDHVFINRAGIPCVDIIDLRADSDTGFCPEWHTIRDTMDGINAATLAEVGQTLLNVIAELEK